MDCLIVDKTDSAKAIGGVAVEAFDIFAKSVKSSVFRYDL